MGSASRSAELEGQHAALSSRNWRPNEEATLIWQDLDECLQHILAHGRRFLLARLQALTWISGCVRIAHAPTESQGGATHTFGVVLATVRRHAGSQPGRYAPVDRKKGVYSEQRPYLLAVSRDITIEHGLK